MPPIVELKEKSTTETPVFLFTLEFASGAIERWCTHRVEVGGQSYEPRVLGHNLWEMRLDAENGIDSLSRVKVTLADADSYCSQLERTQGFKGAKVTVRFLFYDLKNNAPASEETVILRGVAGSPEEITEKTLLLPITSKTNLLRVLLPEVRIQRRCPWKFPVTAEQRQQAAMEDTKGKYSPFYRCGYSPDVDGGVGNLDGETPFTWCDYTRTSCQQRGMFDRDTAGRPTRRFGGVEYVPPSIYVRTHGERSYHVSALVENEARYNDFVPVVYGTAWYAPPIVFARNDGNLTRMEVLLGMGEIEDVLRVVVNEIEIPAGRAGENMTATGWYEVVSYGARTGGFDPNFTDENGNPAGDPYGSMALLSVVVPNRIHDGHGLPKVQVLLRGLRVARYSADGSYLGDAYDNNPAWVILDVLLRTGWHTDDIDLSSFAEAAAYCAEPVAASDLHGNPVWIPRFQCNLVLRRRRSVAEILRGIRAGSRLFLRQSGSGKIQLCCENTLALQQPVKPAGSNSREPLNGGWPAYEFGDGTLGFSGILRKANGEPSIRFWSRTAADTPNRCSIEFQDEFNEYQQDSLSLVDVEDVLRGGQEISGSLNALGIPNFHQASRVVQLELNKSLRGNFYAEFETSVRGVGLKPGDIITISYLKAGLLRQPFRIKSVAPGLNYRTVLITAQIHDDGWYTDDANGSGQGIGRQRSSEIGLPRPLLGATLDEDGDRQFTVEETAVAGADGQPLLSLRVGFGSPRMPSSSSVGIPLLSLSPVVSTEGGTLAGGQTLYYGISAVGEDGSESSLSFLARAVIPPGSNTNQVQLRGLSFAPGTQSFRVYRGRNPIEMYQIAEGQALSHYFTDTGLAAVLSGPPDENYDHANFYWRMELEPERAATIHSATTIGNANQQLPENSLRGTVVRIHKGKGKGQERTVIANSSTTLEIAPRWDVEPDETSIYVVAEPSWRFGALGRSDYVQFELPYRAGATVHICGRAANVNDKECAYELSPVTRWRLGGGGAVPVDLEPPPKPVFGLAPTGRGSVELMNIGFEDLTNTRTVTAGTLKLYYWPELASPSQVLLSQAAGAEDTLIQIFPGVEAAPGSLIQVDSEVMEIEEKLESSPTYRVKRGVQGSTATAHESGSPVFHLQEKVYILPFPRDFFGSPASGRHCFTISIPNARIACAELSVTNMHGESEPAQLCFTNTTDRGLRTLSGGQMTIQVQGYPAIQSNVAPPLVVEEARAVRDIFAVAGEAPLGGPVELQLRQGNDVYCRLTIPAGETISNVVSGFNMPPLAAGALIHLDVLSVPPAGSGTPARDLTVTIRF